MQMIKQSFTCLTPKEEYTTYTKRLERVGRVCYKSEEKMSNLTEVRFIRKIMEMGHEAILEHCSLTFHFIIDRATANALVRHRAGTAFAQESTHFINYAKKFGELTFIESVNEDDKEILAEVYNIIESEYFKLTDIGVTHQFSRQLLPLGFKTELMMTANLREWRHILKLRAHSSAHPQMRKLMRDMLHWFRAELPLYVEDIKGHDFGDDI